DWSSDVCSSDLTLAKIESGTKLHIETQGVTHGARQRIVDDDPFTAPGVASILDANGSAARHPLALRQADVPVGPQRHAEVGQRRLVERFIDDAREIGRASCRERV